VKLFSEKTLSTKDSQERKIKTFHLESENILGNDIFTHVLFDKL